RFHTATCLYCFNGDSERQGTHRDQGLDGHSLYCTEVLPVSTPPSQPITVEGGGTCRRGFVSINGGTSVSQSQPVQYAIVLADPQQQQQHSLGGVCSSALVPSSNTTNILVNTLTQQPYYHQLQQLQFRNQGSASHVVLSSDTLAKPAPALSASPGATGLVIASSGAGSSKFAPALINASNHLNTSKYSPQALVAYSVSLPSGDSQTFVINSPSENGVSHQRSAKDTILLTGGDCVKSGVPGQQPKQPGPGSATSGEHGGTRVELAQPARLVELPEAFRNNGVAPAGIVFLTYAPGDLKPAGSVPVADIASIAQIQDLNTPSSKGFRFEPQPQTRSSSPLSSTSGEHIYKIKDGLCKINSAVLPTTPVVVGNDNSSVISQESNLNNHIRVLSAVNKGLSSSSAFTPELTKPGTAGDRGIWTSLVQSSEVPGRQFGLSQQTQASRTSSPLSPSSSPQSSPPHQHQRHGPHAASKGAPGGMHSGRAGQHPHGSATTTSNNTNSSSSSNSSNSNNGGIISSSSINSHYRPSSPAERNPSKRTHASSPASSVSSSSSPPPPPTAPSLGMLSTGPPSIPAGIFRTGGDSHSHSHANSRLPGGSGGSGSASYAISPYSSLYGGPHHQPQQGAPHCTTAHSHAAHLQAGLAPYPAFFPGSAASSLHGYGPSALMAPAVSSSAGGAAGGGAGHHYPRIESYSAVLASMGSQALQASAGSELDRSLRGPASAVSALQSGPARSLCSTYLPSAASRSGHGFHGGISTGMPSPSSASSPPTSGVARRLSGGSGSPSPGPGASSNSVGGLGPGSRLSPLDKLAAMKAGGPGPGRESSNRLAFDTANDRASRPSPPSGPKVSFDSVVKEFGGEERDGGGDSPPTPGYARASLSGKEGSLKHRILTRPSDSEPPSGEESPGNGQPRDEPPLKRARFSSSSSPLSPTPPLVPSGSHPQLYLGRDEAIRGNNPGHPAHHMTPHHQHPVLSDSSTDHGSTRGGYHHSQAGTSLPPPLTQTHYQPHYSHQQQSTAHYHHQRYQGHQVQDDVSGNNNTTTINKNTRDNSSSNNNTGSSSSNISQQQHSHSGYHSAALPTASRRRQPSSSSSSSPPAQDQQGAPHVHYPQHFMKGSIIQLANGDLKRVEDLQTEDFVSSAQVSADLKVDSSTVVRIEEHLDRGTAMLSFSVGEHRVQVTVEATLEHPFFVFGQGWSSCSVTRTLARYGLDCQKLNVGDVCISLTHKDVSLSAADICQQHQQGEATQHNNGDKKIGQWDLKPAGDSAVSTTAQGSGYSPSSPPASSPSSQPKVSSAMSPLKLDPKDSPGHDLSVLPPPSSSPSTLTSNSKRQQQQQNELPPPLSNFVPVKKESSAPGGRDHYHHHHHRRRSGASASSSNMSGSSSGTGGPASWPRPGGDFSSPDCKEEITDAEAAGGDHDDSADSLSKKRRWSGPDPGLVKAEKERDRERQHQADQAQRLEEREEGVTKGPGDRGDDGRSGGCTISESSPPAPSPPSSTSSSLLSNAK
ncbi:hypothetical protein EGW08_011380, partial [Elysia chlorotica]